MSAIASEHPGTTFKGSLGTHQIQSLTQWSESSPRIKYHLHNSLLQIEGNVGDWIKDWIVKDFLKGAYLECPHVKDRFPSWDLPTVLEAMMKHPFEPIESILLDMLTLKTVFLVAIFSAKRVGELNALDCIPQFEMVELSYIPIHPLYL